MIPLYLLDTGPLSLLTNPRESDATRGCKEWMASTLAAGSRVMIPEIADYELRRELIRAKRTRGLARLDILVERLGLLPTERAVWIRAAELWADARNAGFQTAADHELDGDVILAATAQVAEWGGIIQATVVTTNVGHLARYVTARGWESS